MTLVSGLDGTATPPRESPAPKPLRGTPHPPEWRSEPFDPKSWWIWSPKGGKWIVKEGTPPRKITGYSQWQDPVSKKFFPIYVEPPTGIRADGGGIGTAVPTAPGGWTGGSLKPPGDLPPYNFDPTEVGPGFDKPLKTN